MTRHAVLAGLARRAAEALAALLLLLMPALAGDRALIDFLGYSPDARYFAFEAFGVQDGSGFAYSTIYVIDLSTDQWIAGSPYHARATDETADTPLADIRAEALGKAREKLETLQIDQPADIMTLLGDGVEDAPGKQVKWADPLCCQPGQTQDNTYTLTLETFPVADDLDCEGLIGDRALGYALTVSVADQQLEIHRDGDRIPKSRGCTVDYRIYAVVEPLERNFGRVAIVSSYTFGFEGPDRRFLAVPIDRP